MRLALAIPRKNLISCGVCVGRFSKRSSESSRSFRVHITALDLIAPFAKVLITETILRYLYSYEFCVNDERISFEPTSMCTA